MLSIGNIVLNKFAIYIARLSLYYISVTDLMFTFISLPLYENILILKI